MLELSHSESCDFFLLFFYMIYDFRMGVRNGIK